MLLAVRIIAKSSLQKFWERPGCADARGPLHSWYAEAINATWRSPQDIKDQYASASICGNNRIVFNIGGPSLYDLLHREICADHPHVHAANGARSPCKGRNP